MLTAALSTGVAPSPHRSTAAYADDPGRRRRTPGSGRQERAAPVLADATSGLAPSSPRAQAMVVSRAQLLAQIGIARRDVAGQLRGRTLVASPSPACSCCIAVRRRRRLSRGSQSSRWAGRRCSVVDGLGRCVGCVGWDRPAVHVVVRVGATCRRSPWRRRSPVPTAGAPRTSDGSRACPCTASSGPRSTRPPGPAACAPAWRALAAVVQQGLSTPDRIRPVLDASGPVRHRKALFLALGRHRWWRSGSVRDRPGPAVSARPDYRYRRQHDCVWMRGVVVATSTPSGAARWLGPGARDGRRRPLEPRQLVRRPAAQAELVMPVRQRIIRLPAAPSGTSRSGSWPSWRAPSAYGRQREVGSTGAWR